MCVCVEGKSGARLSQSRAEQQQQEEVSGMMMEASFDTEESFDDPSCLAPQPPGSVSPAKRQITEVKETKITVSTPDPNRAPISCSGFIFLSSVDIP